MNQSRKILMLAAILIVVVGAVMVIGAMALGKTNLKEVAGLSYTMKTFEIQDQFTGISVEDTECRVRILHTEDDGCTVICSEKEDGSVYHTVMVTDGVLMIQRHDERQWFQRIGIFLDVETVDIYLPEKEYGQLVAHSVAGSIQVADGFTFESARLSSVSGSIQMLAQVEEELRAETTSGRVTIEGSSPKELEAKSISGRIVMTHVRSDDIRAKTTFGRIELTDVVTTATLCANSVSGGVALEGCDGGNIRIETTSGSVKGTLLSEKIFFPHSTSGSISVPHSNAGGQCEISTTSGSIHIEIQQ